MKQNIILIALFVFSGLLSSCGLFDIHYDPLLKYENAGYSVSKVGGFDSVLPANYPLYEENLMDRCTNYDYYVELVTNSNVIEQLKIMDEVSSNTRFVYTNRMIGNVIPLSNKVLVMDRSGTLFQFGTDFQNMIKTNLLSDYSNSFKEIVDDQNFSIPPKNIEEITPVYGVVVSVSPNGRYLLVSIPIVWKDVVSSMDDDRKSDAIDNGTAIIDVDKFSVTRLYDISQVDGRGANGSNYEETSFLDITLKYVYINSYTLAFIGKSEGGRTSDELWGWWRIDISSLGLSE